MYTQTGHLVANNYVWVCTEDKRTVICNPKLYLSVKSADPVFLWVCFKDEQTQKLGYHRQQDAFKIKCLTYQQ